MPARLTVCAILRLTVIVLCVGQDLIDGEKRAVKRMNERKRNFASYCVRKMLARTKKKAGAHTLAACLMLHECCP